MAAVISPQLRHTSASSSALSGWSVTCPGTHSETPLDTITENLELDYQNGELWEQSAGGNSLRRIACDAYGPKVILEEPKTGHHVEF